MENQHRIIKGYRELSAEEIALMNEIKAKGEELRALLEMVAVHVDKQIMDSRDPDEVQRLAQTTPGRWISMAKTDFQTGLMALTRAVAQPTSF